MWWSWERNCWFYVMRLTTVNSSSSGPTNHMLPSSRVNNCKLLYNWIGNDVSLVGMRPLGMHFVLIIANKPKAQNIVSIVHNSFAYILVEISFHIWTTWWVSLLVDQWVPECTCRAPCSTVDFGWFVAFWELQNFPCKNRLKL